MICMAVGRASPGPWGFLWTSAYRAVMVLSGDYTELERRMIVIDDLGMDLDL
jgi:hypothetical protein